MCQVSYPFLPLVFVVFWLVRTNNKMWTRVLFNVLVASRSVQCPASSICQWTQMSCKYLVIEKRAKIVSSSFHVSANVNFFLCVDFVVKVLCQFAAFARLKTSRDYIHHSTTFSCAPSSNDDSIHQTASLHQVILFRTLYSITRLSTSIISICGTMSDRPRCTILSIQLCRHACLLPFTKAKSCRIASVARVW